jgi:hypothetical protein
VKTFDTAYAALLPAQRRIWPELRPIRDAGFILYGGTAIALRLNHRRSEDFDFFHSQPVELEQLRSILLRIARPTTLRQDAVNTFSVLSKSGAKMSFFGGINMGQIEEPELTSDGTLLVASLTDLLAIKLKVILQRIKVHDYQDVAAMIRSGVQLHDGLIAAEQLYQPTFSPIDALRALVYFKGELLRLPLADRLTLAKATGAIGSVL